MNDFPDFAMSADLRQSSGDIRFSICTLVTSPEQYTEMTKSLVDGGFGPSDCEYLYIDNSQENRFDAFAGYNLFLRVAQGDYIILCHQDVLLIDDDRSVLERAIADLSERDPSWGACGNAGAISKFEHVIRISDRYGEDQRRGSFPARVSALDENFIIVRKDANLAVSHDLYGFHLYGADLCIHAELLGCTCYVIDFHLRHTGRGTMDPSFFTIRRAMIRKYASAFRSHMVASTTTTIPLSGSRWRSLLYEIKWRLPHK
jgi:hypothetical protein